MSKRWSLNTATEELSPPPHHLCVSPLPAWPSSSRTHWTTASEAASPGCPWCSPGVASVALLISLLG